MYLSVFFSHFLRVSVCPDDRRGRVSSGGHLSQTNMGPKIQNPKGQKSYGLVFYHTFFLYFVKFLYSRGGQGGPDPPPLQYSNFFKHLKLIPKICLPSQTQITVGPPPPPLHFFFILACLTPFWCFFSIVYAAA